MCPRRGNDPASGHPRAHQPPLGRGTSPPAWDGRLDAPGQRRRHLPSSAWTRRREVKQGKSGGSVGTTDQGKGKGRSVVRPMGTVAYRGKGQGKGKGRGEGRLGQGGRGRSKGGEKLMGTTAYGGKGSKGRAANGDRPVGAASCRRDHHTMASCQNPHPPTPADHRCTNLLLAFDPPPLRRTLHTPSGRCRRERRGGAEVQEWSKGSWSRGWPIAYGLCRVRRPAWTHGTGCSATRPSPTFVQVSGRVPSRSAASCGACYTWARQTVSQGASPFSVLVTSVKCERM